MIQKYRKKAVVIEAIQFDGSLESAVEIQDWIQEYDEDRTIFLDGGTIIIPTLEGNMIANKSDFIIKGVKDEFYPCKPDIFAATYDEEGSVSP